MEKKLSGGAAKIKQTRPLPSRAPDAPSRGESSMARVHSAPPSDQADSGSIQMSPDFYARVSRKAFELYERRGGESGREIEDWLEAERLVKQEMRKPKH